MILCEIWYKTHNDELLAIIKIFQTYKYYIESYKYKIFMLVDYNNLQYFIDTKILSF